MHESSCQGVGMEEGREVLSKNACKCHMMLMNDIT